MSGSRHHVIPQFLLRGFANHRSGDAAYTWVYRAGVAPFKTNVLNVAVEGHFYTHDGSPEVDDAITAAEGSFGSIVERLRSGGRADSISPNALAELFVHLELRTRHLRTNFEDMADAVMRRVVDIVSDERLLLAFMLRHLRDDPTYMARALVDEVQKRGVPKEAAETAIAGLQSHMPQLIEAMLPTASAPLIAAFRGMLEKPEVLRSVVRSAQLRALKSGLTPEKKVALYAPLTFSVIEFTTPCLPLGDSAVVARVADERAFRTFVSSGDNLLAVYLPLSPTTALRGHAPTFVEGLDDDLPHAVAACSKEHFIAAERTTAFEQLQQRIGQSAAIFSAMEVETVLSEVFLPQC